MFRTETTQFSTLDTQRLKIRCLNLLDAEDIYAISSDPEVSRYVLWDTHKSIADSRAYLRSVIRQYRMDQPASWGILSKENGHIIGTIGFLWVNTEHNSAEVGYSLGRPYWNRGYMTEALSAVIAFGMNEMHLNRIEAQFDVRNLASGKVMRKVGMQREGLLRQRLYNKGQYIDVEVYAILAKEFKSRTHSR